MSSTEVDLMYVALASSGFGLIVAPTTVERLARHGSHGVRVDQRPGSRSGR